MKTKGIYSKADLRKNAIHLTVERLKPTPVALGQFLLDVAEGREKQWAEFRRAYSDAVQPDLNGRPCPVFSHSTRGSGPASKERLRMFSFCHKDYVARVKPLPLHECHTPKQRVEMILKADISPQIKAEMIAAQL